MFPVDGRLWQMTQAGPRAGGVTPSGGLRVRVERRTERLPGVDGSVYVEPPSDESVFNGEMSICILDSEAGMRTGLSSGRIILLWPGRSGGRQADGGCGALWSEEC